MGKPKYFLVKMSDTEGFANAFRSGKLYANRLSYFRKLEAGKRGDPHEGAFVLSDKGVLTLTATFPGGSETITLTEKDFSRPPLLMPDSVSFLNIFCMHMAHCREFTLLSAGPESRVKLDLEIPEACIQEFGRYAVVIAHPGKFFARVDRMVDLQSRLWRHGPVEYQDPPWNLMHSIRAAFYKDLDLSYQMEYRLVFDINADNEKAVCSEIGDISDISFIHKLPSKGL